MTIAKIIEKGKKIVSLLVKLAIRPLRRSFFKLWKWMFCYGPHIETNIQTDIATLWLNWIGRCRPFWTQLHQHAKSSPWVKFYVAFKIMMVLVLLSAHERFRVSRIRNCLKTINIQFEFLCHTQYDCYDKSSNAVVSLHYYWDFSPAAFPCEVHLITFHGSFDISLKQQEREN